MESRSTIRTSLTEFFEPRVAQAARVQGAPLDPAVARYLSCVLADAATPEGGPPAETFAELRAAAVTAPPREAPARWRRLGEGALVVAGCFTPALSRRNVSRGYCAAMGASAFGVLGVLAAPPARAVFGEVATTFEACADVLALAGQDGDDSDELLRLWTAWRATRSPRLAACLRARGVAPEGEGSA